ncbi:MAG: DUF2249 domain-containing protein [Sciscionella sp.]
MTSEIHIRGTSDDPAVAAQAALVDVGDELLAELSAKVALTTELRLSLAAKDEAQDGLKACCERVLHHLVATDRVMYAVAAGAADTRLLVRALRAHHRLIAAHVADLGRSRHPEQLAAAANAIVALFAACHEIERAVLWPALAALPGVDLGCLLDDLTTVLRGGELHRPEVLDVREIPHGSRHPRIFGIYARLPEGASFVLVNNHDPKPLRREFEATYSGQFSWDYLESGPEQWQVRIGRMPVTV